MIGMADIFARSAKTSRRAITSREKTCNSATSAHYWIHSYPKLVTSSADSYDLAVQQRLWVVSEELTGVTFPVK